MSYPELIARHRKLAPELALSLAPTLGNLLEGRLSAGTPTPTCVNSRWERSLKM